MFRPVVNWHFAFIALFAVANSSIGQDRIEIVCPAIGPDLPYSNSPSQDIRQPELVILGTIREEPEQHIVVDKVISGVWNKKTLQAGQFSGSDGKQWIFCLTPRRYTDEPAFSLIYLQHPAEAKGMDALAAARLDYNALAAEHIFVGKAVKVVEDSQLVSVIRPIAGDLKVGQQIIVGSGNHIRRDQPLVLREQPTLFFLKAPHIPYRDTNLHYEPLWHQPIEREEDVKAALGRRNEYPVREATKRDKTVKVREVVFRGPTSDAIEFLGSTNYGVASLGRRKLLLHADHDSIALIVAAIEKGLFLPKGAGVDEYRRVKNLIGILGEIARGKKRPDIERLLDLALTRIEKDSPELPDPIPQLIERVPTAEQNRSDALHVVVWLLRELDDAVIHERFGPKLLAVRERGKGRWKDEIQLAIDVCGIEDSQELAAAFERMKNVKPVRSTPSKMWLNGSYSLAFSNDGQFLATAGYTVQIWKTSDWSRVAEIAVHASAVRFSPDDRFLYAIGGGSPTLHARYDWRTGKLDKTYAAHKERITGLDISADGRRMATSSPYDKTFVVTDTESGNVVRTLPMVDSNDEFSLSPDGKRFLRVSGKRMISVPGEFSFSVERLVWTMDSLDAPFGAPPDLGGKESWRFSPTRRVAVSCERPDPKDDRNSAAITLAVHDADNLPVLTKHKDAAFGDWHIPDFVISRNGQRLAIRYGGGATIVELPSLKTVRTIDIPNRSKIESIALSPDGTVFAAAVPYHATPYLFNATTGERILPTPAHTDGIDSLHFLADGKSIRTICADHQICTWNAATLTLQKRIAFNPKWEKIGIREPDGRYILCRENLEYDKPTKLHTIDAETGKIVASVDFPKKELWVDQLHVDWLNEREALVVRNRDVGFRIDYLAGKRLADTELKRKSDKEPIAPIAQDAILRINGHFNRFWVEAVDLGTGFSQTTTITLPGHVGAVGEVPGGKYFFSVGDRYFLIDRSSHKILANHPIPRSRIHAAEFSPDGSRFAVIALNEKWDEPGRPKVRIHDTASGKTLGAFVPTSDGVTHMRFSPDGRQLALLSWDNAIELWDISSLQANE